MYYNGVDITVTLPDGVDACDIGTFTVWCEPFQAIFTRIEIPTSIFVSRLFMHYLDSCVQFIWHIFFIVACVFVDKLLLFFC